MKPTGRKFTMKERREEINKAIRTGDWREIPPLLEEERIRLGIPKPESKAEEKEALQP